MYAKDGTPLLSNRTRKRTAWDAAARLHAASGHPVRSGPAAQTACMNWWSFPFREGLPAE